MLLDWGVSIRSACRVLPLDTSSYHYQSCRTDTAFLKKRVKEICAPHIRYGYRRVSHILRREGRVVNAKKVYRLYRVRWCWLSGQDAKPIPT
jgi:putative transposase